MDENMMKALIAKAKPMAPEDKDHKMAVVQELLKMASDMMVPDQGMNHSEPDADDMPMNDDVSTDKVTVAAANPQDLRNGLDMAKNVMDKGMRLDMDHNYAMNDQDTDDMEEDDEDEMGMPKR